jgi:anthrone oxygenase-like protein
VNTTSRAARICNLFLAGALTGNEFGGFVGFHPALYRLPTDAHATAEQEITTRFGKIMPPFMVGAIVSFVPPLSLTQDRSSFRFTLAGMLCYVAMLAVTFAGNMPANRRTLDLDPKTVPTDEFLAVRGRWDAFHAVRNLLTRRASYSPSSERCRKPDGGHEMASSRPPIDGGTVLITGASSGIGLELARELAPRARSS